MLYWVSQISALYIFALLDTARAATTRSAFETVTERAAYSAAAGREATSNHLLGGTLLIAAAVILF